VVVAAAVAAAAAEPASGVDAAAAARLHVRLQEPLDPVVHETVRESLAAATPDALAAFDAWYALAQDAAQHRRRVTALRRAAVLGLMLGQHAKLERLLRSDDAAADAELVLIAELLAAQSDVRDAASRLQPLLDDGASVARLAAWWGPSRTCAAGADPLLCGGRP